MNAISILSWVVLGGIAGWIASLVTGRNRRMGCLANVIAGVLGGLIGGFVMSLLGRPGVTGLNLPSLDA